VSGKYKKSYMSNPANVKIKWKADFIFAMMKAFRLKLVEKFVPFSLF